MVQGGPQAHHHFGEGQSEMPELIPVSADDGTPVPEAPMTVYETKITHDESTTHTALDDGAPRGLVGLRCRFRGSRAPATVSRVKRSLSFSGGHHAETPPTTISSAASCRAGPRISPVSIAGAYDALKIRATGSVTRAGAGLLTSTPARRTTRPDCNDTLGIFVAAAALVVLPAMLHYPALVRELGVRCPRCGYHDDVTATPVGCVTTGWLLLAALPPYGPTHESDETRAEQHQGRWLRYGIRRSSQRSERIQALEHNVVTKSESVKGPFTCEPSYGAAGSRVVCTYDASIGEQHIGEGGGGVVVD